MLCVPLTLGMTSIKIVIKGEKKHDNSGKKSREKRVGAVESGCHCVRHHHSNLNKSKSLTIPLMLHGLVTSDLPPEWAFRIAAYAVPDLSSVCRANPDSAFISSFLSSCICHAISHTLFLCV